MIQKITKKETFFYKEKMCETYREALMESLEADLCKLWEIHNKLYFDEKLATETMKDAFLERLDAAKESFVELFRETIRI